MTYNIKKVKDYLKSGSVQFDVIQRRESGQTWEAHFESATEELDFSYKRTVYQQSSEGIIQVVKRISDDRVMHQGDMVDIIDGSSGFIVEFNENLVHVTIATLDAEEVEVEVEINQLETMEDLIIGDLSELYESDEEQEAGN